MSELHPQLQSLLSAERTGSAPSDDAKQRVREGVALAVAGSAIASSLGVKSAISLIKGQVIALGAGKISIGIAIPMILAAGLTASVGVDSQPKSARQKSLPVATPARPHASVETTKPTTEGVNNLAHSPQEETRVEPVEVPPKTKKRAKRRPTYSVSDDSKALREVLRALQDGQIKEAQTLLRRNTRKYPTSQLVEDRDYLETRIACALEKKHKLQLVETFASKFPTSLHLTRLKRACNLD